MISLWIVWLISAVLMLVVEISTGSMVALCLSLGCLVAIIPDLAGVSAIWQTVVMIAASTAAFVFLRPTLRKLIKPKNTREYRTNMDALIGRTGKVTHQVTHHYDDNGRVQIDGDSWLAYTTSPDCPIPHGTQVVVEDYESLVLRVRPLSQGCQD